MVDAETRQGIRYDGVFGGFIRVNRLRGNK